MTVAVLPDVYAAAASGGATGFDLVGIAVAAAAATFALLEARTARRSANLAELQSQRELAEEWRQLQPEWEGLLMLGGHLYLKPSEKAVDRYPGMLTERADRYRRLVHFNKHRSWSEISDELDESDVQMIETAGGLEVPDDIYRLPLEFLARVGESVIMGRVSVSAVYGVLGPATLRNSGSVRFVVDVAPASTYYLIHYPGVRRRVLMLLDLLWAYAARVGDLEQFDRDHAVAAKVEAGTGPRNRARVRKYGRLFGAGRWKRWSHDWLLTAAEVSHGVAGSWKESWRRLRRWVRGMKTDDSGTEELFPRRDLWA